MAKKRKTRKKNVPSIKLNKYNIGFSLIAVSAIYFFAVFVVKTGLLFQAISIPSNFLFGEYGSLVFFGLLGLIGISILFREDFLKKGIFKKFLILMFLITAILNFQTLTNNHISPEQLGGWLGYITLWVFNRLLGGQIFSVKILTISLLLVFLLWAIYSLKIKVPLPKVKFIVDGEEEKKDTSKNSQKKKNTVSSTAKQNANTAAAEPAETTSKATDPDKKILKNLLKNRIGTKMMEKNSQKEATEKTDSSKQNKVSSKTQTSQKAKGETSLKTPEKQPIKKFPKDKPTFDINLLEQNSEDARSQISDEYIHKKARTIQNKLNEFSIPVEIEGFNIGPTIIQLKIKPEAGIKISKIENLKKDLSLALKTKSLRIIAPIPGSDSVGIEIPNPTPEKVTLGDILSSENFSKDINKNLTNISVGKGIDGKSVVKALEDMPHILIAGATGSGKSVGINDFILSLIYQNSPSELKFIMIDPKQVELGIYEGIPYLLSPIITEPEKAIKVLKWAVNHMNERYQYLKKYKVRNIEEYNKKAPEQERMYRIVIIIDELADFMMSGSKKDTENAISRISQMARAVGIHLIVATQRPSTNVITGLIKANIPTRIAYGVVSWIDSRTILDSKGAEDLLGKGDLLYVDSSSKFATRIQAPFVSTLETEKVVDAIKERYMKGISEEEIYDEEIMNLLNSQKETSEEGGGKQEEDEEMIQKATEIIIQTRKASATLLQRKLGIGFARAAKMMDILEERGIIGPQEGAKPRDILV